MKIQSYSRRFGSAMEREDGQPESTTPVNFFDQPLNQDGCTLLEQMKSPGFDAVGVFSKLRV